MYLYTIYTIPKNKNTVIQISSTLSVYQCFLLFFVATGRWRFLGSIDPAQELQRLEQCRGVDKAALENQAKSVREQQLSLEAGLQGPDPAAFGVFSFSLLVFCLQQ